jgi:integrase/recombinase XerC
MAPFFVPENFELYLQSEKRFSEHTVTAYLNDVSQFAAFAEVQNQRDWQEVSYRLIRSWMVRLIEGGISNRSVNRKLTTLRTFFKWGQRTLFVVENPMLRIVGPKQEKKLPSFVHQTDIGATKTNPLFNSSFEGLRDKLMFELFYQTGMRLSELIELKEKDVTSQSVKVIGKRNKERIIPISSDLFGLIQTYLLTKKQAELDSLFLVVLNNGNKLYPKFVYRKINYYLGGVTSMEKRSPHVLRHTFATHMLNNGAGLETLKDILGHASLSATQVYTHSSFTQLTNIYSQSHPRGRKKD